MPKRRGKSESLFDRMEAEANVLTRPPGGWGGGGGTGGSGVGAGGVDEVVSLHEAA